MKFATPLLALSLAIGASASSVLDEDAFLAALMRRQELGTPKGNCHDNCGTAITLSKSSPDPCKSKAFLTDYAYCLQCAGPDNQNIWRYYGATLSAAGSKCGLETEPKSGKQEDVPEAVKGHEEAPASSSAATSSAAPASSTAAPASSAAGTTAAASRPTSSSATASPSPSEASPSTTAVIPVSSGTAVAGTAVPTVSFHPSASSNVTVTTPTVAIQTTNAAVSNFGGSEWVVLFGAVLMGAMGLN